MASIHRKENKNGSVSYVVRVYAGRDERGKARYRSKSYMPGPGKGKRAVEKKIREICEELERQKEGPALQGPAPLFSDYVQHFLQKKQLVCSEYTMQSYRLALAKACRYLGQVRLDRLNGEHLDRMTRAMRSEKSQYGKPYSAAYIRHIHTLVRMTLGMAVREGVIPVNPADKDHYTMPKQAAKEPVFLELEEARAYIRAAREEQDPKLQCMVLLLLYTGIRMEELCGLAWEDIDLERGEIRIRRASVYVAGKGVITKPPKTRSGSRVLCADPTVFQALTRYKQAQQRTCEAQGLPWEESRRLFTKQDGGALIPGTTAKWLQRFAKKHGLRPVTPHKLRHTYATLQIAYGTDIRTVAGMMGHSSPMTTLTIYAHQLNDASRKAARAMTELLTPEYADET